MKNGDLKQLDDEGLQKDEAEEPEYVVYKARWLVLLSIVTVGPHFKSKFMFKDS